MIWRLASEQKNGRGHRDYLRSALYRLQQVRLQNRRLGGRNCSLSATSPQCSHFSMPGGRSSGGAMEEVGVEAGRGKGGEGGREKGGEGGREKGGEGGREKGGKEGEGG